MSLDPVTFAAILGMALVTYACRLAGILIAGRFQPSGRAKAAFDAIPPAVLTAVIAPTLLATGWPETAAGVLTIAAATRLPLMATIAVGVVAVVVFRVLAGG
jgi:uncharacterized membrane protein